MITIEKIGQIFNPAAHNLEGFDCCDFAQSPQALVFDSFIRVYFSTRKKDTNGKFLSVIRYVDFSKDWQKVIGFSSQEVIELGALGTFDEHGIFPFSPLRKDHKILAYTCGWSRRVSVSVETSTGLAESFDNGETFTKIGTGPVFSNSLNQPFLVGDSFVLHKDEKFHMWYMFGERWIPANGSEPEARVYKLGYAHSKNGIDWWRNDKAIIQDKLDNDECQALPTVLFKDGVYHMFFCYRRATDFRTNPERAYKIGYAFSKDLVTWQRNDELINWGEEDVNGWDYEMKCYPNICEMDNQVYLLYNGNAFGKYGFGVAKVIL